MKICFLLALSSIALVSCNNSSTNEQQVVAKDFLQLILTGKDTVAWQLTSNEFMQDVSYNNFVVICDSFRKLTEKKGKKVKFVSSTSAISQPGKYITILYFKFLTEKDLPDGKGSIRITFTFDEPNLVSAFEFRF